MLRLVGKTLGLFIRRITNNYHCPVRCAGFFYQGEFMSEYERLTNRIEQFNMLARLFWVTNNAYARRVKAKAELLQATRDYLVLSN
jgi:hypothetical protein